MPFSRTPRFQAFGCTAAEFGSKNFLASVLSESGVTTPTPGRSGDRSGADNNPGSIGCVEVAGTPRSVVEQTAAGRTQCYTFVKLMFHLCRVKSA
jgi:hypothetical protein